MKLKLRSTRLFPACSETRAFLLHVVRKKECFFSVECWKPSAHFLLSRQRRLSGLPWLCLIKLLRRPVGLSARRLPRRTTRQPWRQKKENSHAMLPFSLCHHLYQIPVLSSISKSYRVPFRSASQSAFIHIGRSLRRGRDKWGLVFLKASIMKLCGDTASSQITRLDFNQAV